MKRKLQNGSAYPTSLSWRCRNTQNYENLRLIISVTLLSLISNFILAQSPINLGTNNGSQYYCSPTIMNWAEAKNYANSLGGHLLVINSSAENHFIQNGILAEEVWIGKSDAQSEGHFVWVNNLSASFTNWSLGEPNDQSVQYYGSADYTILKRSNGKWYDRHGLEKYEVVVEVPTTNPCTPLTDGGTILYDGGLGCGAFDPDVIHSTEAPSGGSDSIEYMWLSSTDECPTSVDQAISGAHQYTAIQMEQLINIKI